MVSGKRRKTSGVLTWITPNRERFSKKIIVEVFSEIHVYAKCDIK